MRKLALFLLLIPSLACAQSVRYQSQATGQRGPIAGASVAVCTQPANTSTTPCSPLATLATSTSTTSGGVNPVTTDQNGNFFFYAVAGLYTIQIYGPQITSPFIIPDVSIGPGLGANNTFPGDMLFKSGRPWYDVMAFGACNNNTCDDTAAIQAAVTAACATTYKGGTIYFPPGAGYKSANTSTSPITISCDNLAFIGAGYNTQSSPTAPPSQIICAACTVPVFTDGGTQRFGFQVRYLGINGNTSSATSTGISLGNVGDYTLEQVFFNNFGGSAFVTTSGFSGTLYHNFAQNCLMQRPASTDTGCFDLGNNDLEAQNNFVTTSNSTAAGNIGTGHTYAWVIRGTNGFFTNNMGEISQHGWLVLGNQNQLIGNRAFLIQGNGFTISGNSNIVVGNKSIDVSQTANQSFDCFLMGNVGTLGGNIVSENQCEMDGSGNGNNFRYAITDTNSAGVGEFNANRYINNRWRTNLGLGFFNRTGGAPVAVTQAHTLSGDKGDTSPTLVAGLDQETVEFNTVLTANRTVTLQTALAWPGARFRITRTTVATGAFTLVTANTTPIVTIGIGQSVDFEFINGGWLAMIGTQTIATGTAAMTTASIAAVSGTTITCGATVTVAAPGVATTDSIVPSANAAESSPNTGLILRYWPTSNNVNFAWCNPTASALTPSAETINWRVVR